MSVVHMIRCGHLRNTLIECDVKKPGHSWNGVSPIAMRLEMHSNTNWMPPVSDLSNFLRFSEYTS